MIRLSDRMLAILFALYAFGIALWLTMHGAQSLIDDGFYYFKIAEHLARGEGSTFDSIHLTNGYHPLWAFLLVPIFANLPADEFARSVASIVQGVFFAASSALFYASARLLVRQRVSIIGAFLWSLFTYRLSLSATEFSLQALCVTIITFVYLRWFRGDTNPTDRKYLALGILLSIAFLARIEFLLLALSLGLFFLRTPRKLLFFALPLILVFSMYAVTNLLLFKYPFPISSAVKLAWSDYYLSQNPIFQNLGWLVAKIDLALLPVRGLFALRHLSEMLLPGYLVLGSYGAAILLAAAWTADRIGSHQLYRRIKPLAPFILYSLLCVLGYVVLFQDFLAFTPWYFVIQPWLVAIMFGILLHVISDWLLLHWRLELAKSAVLIVMVLLGVGIAAYTLRSISFPISPSEAKPKDPLENTALWLRDNTPRDAVVGSWNAGIISFYSQRRVVNLDGLVNSWGYFQRDQYDLCRYWEENRIAFVADVFDAQRVLSPVPSYPYYKKCADQMVLIWSDNVQGISGRVQIYFLRR